MSMTNNRNLAVQRNPHICGEDSRYRYPALRKKRR